MLLSQLDEELATRGLQAHIENEAGYGRTQSEIRATDRTPQGNSRTGRVAQEDHSQVKSSLPRVMRHARLDLGKCKAKRKEVSMYITAYFDKTNSTLHCYVSQDMPTIPDDEEDSIIAVFDTDKPIPSEQTIISKAQMVEVQGGTPQFGDDSISQEFDLSQDDHFGTKLKQIYHREF
jgi:hypothetical protein